MANLTVRNIPDELMKKIKNLSKIDKRSINNQILILLEKSIYQEKNSNYQKTLSKEIQIKLWYQLSGLWEDDRSTEKIINDIYSKRSHGRNISL